MKPSQVSLNLKTTELDFFEKAFARREKLFNRSEFGKNQTFRIFHGPTEVPPVSDSAPSILQDLAIDVYGCGIWITHWRKLGGALSETHKKSLGHFLSQHDFLKKLCIDFGVIISREENCLDSPEVLFGEVPEKPWIVKEWGISYEICFKETRHPGLFLDHSPLRYDLINQNWCRSKTVLNTFAYTGSLSMASAAGGAHEVLTLDISKPTIEWAKRNWEINAFKNCKGDFIFGDAFDWFKRFKKKNRQFDVLILDPPSFSRIPGKSNSKSSRVFSTSKDLSELHQLAFEILSPGGIVITSINSSNVSREDYWDQIESGLANSSVRRDRKIEVLKEIRLEPSFCGVELQKSKSYLKGWVLKMTPSGETSGIRM